MLPYHTTRPVRRRAPRRRFQGGLHPWTLAIGILIVVAGVWMLNRERPQSAANDAALLRERTDAILGALRNQQGAPSYDQSGVTTPLTAGWTITGIDVVGWRGRTLVALAAAPDSATSAHATWELRWTKRTVGGWTCREILNVDQVVDYDPLGWQK